MATNKEFVVKNGIISFGPVTLPSAPTLALHAATKAYVDLKAGVQSVAGKTGPDVLLVKGDVGLGNAENKSSATIRGEITSANVTTALGFTPVNKAGDTVTGIIRVPANPTEALQVVPKSYVDTQVATYAFDVAGSAGQILFLDKDGSESYQFEDTLKVGTFVNTTAELDAAKQAWVPPRDIFDTWNRISHSTTTTAQPALPTEVDGWVYDDATQAISNSLNTVSMVGFVSLKKYDNYLHAVKLTSTSGDNDLIGVILAFTIDESGREHTLTAVRSRNGSGTDRVWGVLYNGYQTGSITVANGSLLAPGTTDQLGWDVIPNGTTIQVDRDRDIIEVVCSQFNQTTLDTATKLTIDLTSQPYLEKFRGPKSYGYVAQSQANAKFTDILFSEPNNAIYDVRTNEVLVSDISGNYTVDEENTIASIYGPKRMLYNDTTGKMFYILEDGTINQINSSSGGSTPVQTATAMRLGVVQIGNGLTVNGAGILSANVPSLSIASASTLGVVRVGTGLAIDANGILSSQGTINRVESVATGTSVLTGTPITSGTVGVKGIRVTATSGITIGSSTTDLTIAANTPVLNITANLTIDPTLHANTYIRHTGTSNITITFPAGTMNVPHEFHIRQASTGTITIAGASGVVVNAPYGGTLVSAGLGATMTVKMVADSAYDLFGQTTQ